MRVPDYTKDNTAPVGAGRGVGPSYESAVSELDIGAEAVSASPDFAVPARCECCGQVLPERPLGMDRGEMARADALGLDAETHSILSGVLFQEEIAHVLEGLRLADEPVHRPSRSKSTRPRSPAAEWRGAAGWRALPLFKPRWSGNRPRSILS